MAETITIRTGAATDVIKVIEAGPQGPAGSNGTNGQGVPVGGTTGQVLRKASGTNYDTEWGTGGGSVTFGTTAGTACEGNDSRIADIPNGTGSIALGQSGTRTTLNGTASGSNKTISLPNATGTLALTQQATDYEVTDETKGVIMKSANGTRWRVTIDDNGSLLRTALATLILSALMLCGTKAQVRDLVYGTNNVVVGPTNGVALSFTNSVAFSNPITFGTNAATIRTNLGLDWSALTNSNAATSLLGLTTNGQVVANTGTNALTFTNNINVNDTTLTSAGLSWANTPIIDLEQAALVDQQNVVVANWGSNSVSFHVPIDWTAPSQKSITRGNLGLGSLATNNSVPSGAATTNSILTADGAGGSSFVASRVQRVTLTNSFSVTNTSDLTVTNGNVPTMTVDLEANSLYVARWSVLLTCGAEGAKLEATAGAGTNGIINQSVAGRLGRPAFSYGDTFFNTSGSRQVMSLIGFSGAGFTSGVTNGVFNGIAQFRTGASNTTLFWRFAQNSASNVATTLLSNSIFYVEKLSP